MNLYMFPTHQAPGRMRSNKRYTPESCLPLLGSGNHAGMEMARIALATRLWEMESVSSDPVATRDGTCYSIAIWRM